MEAVYIAKMHVYTTLRDFIWLTLTYEVTLRANLSYQGEMKLLGKKASVDLCPHPYADYFLLLSISLTSGDINNSPSRYCFGHDYSHHSG